MDAHLKQRGESHRKVYSIETSQILLNIVINDHKWVSSISLFNCMKLHAFLHLLLLFKINVIDIKKKFDDFSKPCECQQTGNSFDTGEFT